MLHNCVHVYALQHQIYDKTSIILDIYYRLSLLKNVLLIIKKELDKLICE